MQDNPLYQPADVPSFATIKPEHAQAIVQILQENRAKLEALTQQESPTWQTLMHPLEVMDNRLSKAFSPISHLHSVCSTKEWREAYESVLPAISEYSAQLSQNSDLFNAIERLAKSSAYQALTPSQKKVVDDALEDFKRSGVALPEKDKERFRTINLRLSELSMQFSNHVLDATNAWHYHLTDVNALKGIPESSLALLKEMASARNEEGYCITLDAPVVIAVLSYADDRSLREKVYRAYNARASELSDEGKFDNQEIIREILSLRFELAQLLGFEDYAALSVDSKMAKEKKRVNQFLNDLLAKTKAQGLREMQELREFAKHTLNIDTLEPWDVSYASEKLRAQNYSISQEDLRPYFPLPSVIDGLFAISAQLFGVQFRGNQDLSTWHKDVRAYDVLNKEGKLIAQFYLDPYARSQKRAGAWMDSAVCRFKDGAHLQLPVAYLVCNFTPAGADGIAYITHDEVTTLFHEFGHGLHHMLTTVDEYAISGINGVEWDAVEQPSQMMENFCYDWNALQMMSAHKETGAKLPRDLYEKLERAKNFQSAMMMLRQLEFAIFDFQIHSKDNQGKDVLEVLKAVRQQVAVTPDYAHNRFPMQFSHIFAGGYAAGYYSYKWAEVLSADSFSLFAENGVLSATIGAKFRDEILATGGSRASLESFIAFRGREPDTNALLVQSGIKA